MGLLPQIDLKAVDAGQKTVNQQSRSKPDVGADTEESKPFNEQLNKQIEQVKSKSDNHKIDNNQQDTDKSVESAEKANEPAVDTELESVELEESVEIVESVSSNNLHHLDINEPLEVDGLTPLIATVLPETGSALPLSNAPTQILNPVKGGQLAGTQSPVIVSGENLQPASSIDTKPQHINELINKVPVTPVKQSQETLETIKPLNVPVNLTTTLSEKANTQDARYTRVISEMPASDVIAQTTRLQQVPLTTAISSSVLAAQNISLAPTVESINSGFTGALNTLTSTTTLNSSIAVNIQNPNWSQQMTQQVSYMIKGGFQQAEIKLNPAHLGPMEIKLTVNDDQASINFVAQHAPVRDALDVALPRLKEMLEQQGLNLADVDVSTQSEQQQASAESQQDGGVESQPDALSENAESGDIEQELIVNLDANSGVSIFA